MTVLVHARPPRRHFLKQLLLCCVVWWVALAQHCAVQGRGHAQMQHRHIITKPLLSFAQPKRIDDAVTNFSFTLKKECQLPRMAQKWLSKCLPQVRGGGQPYSNASVNPVTPENYDNTSSSSGMDRDGSNDNKSNSKNRHANATVEKYVAAVEEKDAQHRSHHQFHSSLNGGNGDATSRTNLRYHKNRSNEKQQDTEHGETVEDEHFSASYSDVNDGNDDDLAEPSSPVSSNLDEDPTSGVGVKSHYQQQQQQQQQQKKSNAVGDPDGDDSDNDTDDSSEDWEQFEDEMEDLDMLSGNGKEGLDDHGGEPSHQLQVEVELVEDEVLEEMLEDEEHDEQSQSRASGGGGVARIGQRVGRRRSRNEWRTGESSQKKGPALETEEVVDAWMPHVFLPPSPLALAQLNRNARMIDASSKNRLDRRTLYSGLLLEWLNKSVSNRKFMDSTTSQSLQAALSLATQPQWRRSFPRPSAIRLFENDVGKSCTLGMQETIAMALVSRLRYEYHLISSIDALSEDTDLGLSETGGRNKQDLSTAIPCGPAVGKS